MQKLLSVRRGYRRGPASSGGAGARPTARRRGACNASSGRVASRSAVDFRTFEACSARRILYGTTAFCAQNPRYLPYWQGRGFGEEPQSRSSRKKKHRR